MLSIAVIIVLSYLAGSIPFSVIVSKAVKGIDIREHGSGNAGFTNVVRILGIRWGVLVFIGDLVKGYIPTVYFSQIRWDAISIDPVAIALLAGSFAVIGHIWPVYIGFKGGKGVLTIAGMMLGLAPLVTSICLLLFVIIFAVSRYVSLGSMPAGLLFPIIIVSPKYYLNEEISPFLLSFSIICGLLIVFTHRANIKRLLNGTENQFKRSSK